MEQNNKTLTTGRDQMQIRLMQVFNYFDKLKNLFIFSNVLILKKARDVS